MNGWKANLIILTLISISDLLFGEGSSTGQPVCSFSGTVSLGEDFQYELPSGLLFTIESIDYGPEGWALRIYDPAYPSDNFCSVVTPPYRGINALQIYAWHFLNETGTGLNDGSVNAPGEERKFYFVTDKASYEEAFETLSAMLWPESPEAQEAAAEVHDCIHREYGVLTVTELVTGITSGDSIPIESIEFDVELFLPEQV